ncbi:hypothetical protein [Lacticaseibacillus suibinensis]|uniref:hypothetical protein n=1 Tax=Lacticaseibacillus suibinensis TaxID=2486011 RepID=UPI0013DE5BC3|nr:hypothetical protein [Lacticaseibacillus suibinensis]
MMNLEEIAKRKAQEILTSKGINVTCPFCKKDFLARSMNVECPHCHKTLDVEFNLK